MWNRIAPTKANILRKHLNLHVRLGPLYTRLNLLRIRVPLQSSICALRAASNESESHLFLDYPKVTEVNVILRHWWRDISITSVPILYLFLRLDNLCSDGPVMDDVDMGRGLFSVGNVMDNVDMATRLSSV